MSSACAMLGLLAGLLEHLEGAEGLVVYVLIACGVLAGGLGVPIPEEAVLGAAGWLAASGRVTLLGAYAVAWGAIFTWDMLLHEVGRRLGPRLEASRFGRRIGPERLAQAHRFFERHGLLAVAIARFVMGTRIAVFLLAGATGIPRGRFALVVGGLGLVSCAIPLALGYVLGRDVERWLPAFRGVQLALLAGVVLLVVVWFWRRR